MFKIKTKIAIISALLTMIGSFWFFANDAQAIKKLDVSAYILNNKNKEIPNGEYEIRFAIYTKDRTTIDKYPSNADAGSRVWEETQKVKIENGSIGAFLGEENPLPADLNFSEADYYIGIRINTDSEMVPRKKIGAVPLASDAYSVGGATLGTGEGNLVQLSKGGKLDEKILPSIATLGVVSSGTWEGDAVAANFGGTGLTTYAAGDMLFASASDALSNLAIGTNGQVLTVSGGLPTWMDLLSAQSISDTDDALVIADSNADGLGDIFFRIADTNKMVVLNNGNVGIGVENPAYALDVNGTINASSLIINGEATLGTSGENVTINSNLIPSTTGLNLGAASNHWSNLYVDNLSVGGTDLNGTSSEYFVINSDSVVDETMGLRFYRSSLNGYAALVWNATLSQFNLFQRENTSELGDLNVGNLSAVGIDFDNALYSTSLGYTSGQFNIGNYNTNVGYAAGSANTTGYENSAIGALTLSSSSTGYKNSAMGMQTLQGNTSGYQNSAMGAYSLFQNTTGNNNSVLGYYAGGNITTGSNNIIIGANINAPSATASNQLNIGNTIYGDLSTGYVGIGTTTPNNKLQVVDLVDFNDSLYSTSLGYQAGSVNAGTWNSFVGYQAGKSNTTGINNSAVGYQSLYQNTTGQNNAALGYQSLINNTIGWSNSAFGMRALRYNSTGGYNSAFGQYSIYSNTTGNYNSAVGADALRGNTTGNFNVALGYGAGFSSSTGSSNIFLGSYAGYNETGSNKLYIDNSNTASPLIYGDFSTNILTVNGSLGIGTASPNNSIQVTDLLTFTNTDSRTQVGYQAGKYDLGQYNTWIGYQAGSANNATGKTNAADANTGVGYQALHSNTTGYGNSAFGLALGLNTTGHDNSAVGYGALGSNTTGFYNSAVGYAALAASTTGNYNSAFGVAALNSGATTSSYNAAFGTWSLAGTSGGQNSAFGHQSGGYISTGTYNTFLGYNAGYNASQLATAVNSMALGNGAYTTASNQVVIGNSSVTQTILQGNILPGANDANDLGSTANRFRDLYLGGETMHIGTSLTDEATLDYNTTTNVLNIGTDATSNGDIAFFTDDLYLDKSTGSIGVGTTTPSSMLDIFDTTVTTGNILSLNQNTSAFSGVGLKMDFGNGVGSFTGDFMNFSNAGSQVFEVQNSGKIQVNRYNGIGGGSAFYGNMYDNYAGITSSMMAYDIIQGTEYAYDARITNDADLYGTAGAMNVLESGIVGTSDTTNTFNVNHYNTDKATNLFYANMANGSGSFIGSFLDFNVDSVNKFRIDAYGNVSLPTSSQLVMGPGNSFRLWDDGANSHIITNDDTDRNLVINTGVNNYLSLDGKLAVSNSNVFLYHNQDGLSPQAYLDVSDGMDSDLHIATGLDKSVFMNGKLSVSNGLTINNVNNNPLVINNTADNDSIQIYDTSSTVGNNMINLNHSVSANSSDMIHANMANGSGSFTGDFLDFNRAGNEVFRVDNRGTAHITPQDGYYGIYLNQYGNDDGGRFNMRANDISQQNNYAMRVGIYNDVDNFSMAGALNVYEYGSLGTANTTNTININHNGSDKSTDLFYANMANGTGSFTGDFLDFNVNSVNKFRVDSSGNVEAAGNLSTTGYLNVGGNTLLGPTADNHLLQLYASAITDSSILYVNQSISDMTYPAMRFDMAAGSGTFTSDFIQYNNNSVSKFKVDNAGQVSASDGFIHKTNAGACTDALFTTDTDGQICLDSTAGVERMYFRTGGAWSYIAKTGGFQIPNYEVAPINQLSKNALKGVTQNELTHFQNYLTQQITPGELLIPYADSTLTDGAIHGLYARFADVKDQMFQEEKTQIENLNLQVTGNITTVAELKNSVNTQLGSIEKSLAAITNGQDTITKQISNTETKITNLENLATTLQAQITALQSQIATPVNIAQIDANTQAIDYLNQLLGITPTSKAGDITIVGKLTSQITETGQLTITVNDKDAATIGEATIKAGDTSVTVKTTAVGASSKIYITPIGSTDNQVVYVKKVNSGQDFEVGVDRIDAIATPKSIRFNWWIVDEK